MTEKCVEYSDKWVVHFQHILIFAWTALDQPLEWKFIETSAKYIASKGRFDFESCDNELFDQCNYLKKFATEERIQSWDEKEIGVDKRWVECFEHFAKNNVPYNHIIKIISYIFCLPGTSAPVERVFSLINDIWTSDKTQLSVQTLRDLLYVRYNINKTCLEFFDFIKKQHKLLEKIGSEDKYAFKTRN